MRNVSHIAGLVSIDTPWTGSPWGGTGYAKLIQTLANGELPAADADAWTCLRRLGAGGSGGCTTPSYLPKTIPIAQIAGDITVRRTYFGLHGYDISLGSDTIVGGSSQHGYIGSAAGSALGTHTTLPTVTCTATMNAILAEGGQKLGSRGGLVGSILGGLTGTELQLLADGKAMDAIGSDQASPALIEILARAYVSVPCAHTNMTTNPDTIDVVTAALRSQASAQALIPTDLLNAPIPATCQHDAGRLVDGTLPLVTQANAPPPGFATVLRDDGRFLVQPVVSEPHC